MEFKTNTQAFPTAFTKANSLSIPCQYSYSSFVSSLSPFNVNTSTFPFSLTCVNTPSPFTGFVSPFTQYLNYYPNYPSFTPLTPLTPVPLCPGTCSSSASTYNSPTLCSSAVSALQNVPRYSPLLVSSCSPSLHSSLRSTQSHSSSSSSARTQPQPHPPPPPPLQPLPAPNVRVSSEFGGSSGTEHLTRCVASSTYYPHSYDALLVKSSFAASQFSQASQASQASQVWIAPSVANSFGVSFTKPAVRFSELQVPQSAQRHTLKRQFEAYHADSEQQQWAGLVHTCGGGSGLGRGSIAVHHSPLATGSFGEITSDSALGAANASSIDIGVPHADQQVHMYNPKYQYDAFYGQERDSAERTREATTGGASGCFASSKRTHVTSAAFECHATPPLTSASLEVGVPPVPAALPEAPAAKPVSGLSYDRYECSTNAPERAHHARQQRGVTLGYGQHGFHMDCSGMVVGTGFDAEFGISGIDREPEHLVKPPFSYIALITMVIRVQIESVRYFTLEYIPLVTFYDPMQEYTGKLSRVYEFTNITSTCTLYSTNHTTRTVLLCCK